MRKLVLIALTVHQKSKVSLIVLQNHVFFCAQIRFSSIDGCPLLPFRVLRAFGRVVAAPQGIICWRVMIKQQHVCSNIVMTYISQDSSNRESKQSLCSGDMFVVMHGWERGHLGSGTSFDTGCKLGHEVHDFKFQLWSNDRCCEPSASSNVCHVAMLRANKFIWVPALSK